MEQQKFRVMHKDTGKVKEVTKTWLETAKRFGVFKDYELVGPVPHLAFRIPAEDEVKVPESKIPKTGIPVQIIDNEPIKEEEPKKNKRGRKSKQK